VDALGDPIDENFQELTFHVTPLATPADFTPEDARQLAKDSREDGNPAPLPFPPPGVYEVLYDAETYNALKHRQALISTLKDPERALGRGHQQRLVDTGILPAFIWDRNDPATNKQYLQSLIVAYLQTRWIVFSTKEKTLQLKDPRTDTVVYEFRSWDAARRFAVDVSGVAILPSQPTADIPYLT